MSSSCSHDAQTQSGEAYTLPAVVSTRSVGTRPADVRKTATKMHEANPSFDKLRPTFSAPPPCFLSFEPKTPSKAIHPITVGVGLSVGVSVGVGVLVGVEVGEGVGVGSMSKTTLSSYALLGSKRFWMLYTFT